MRDAPVLLAATETLLRYLLASSRNYTATPAQFLIDMALSIALRQPEAAYQAAAAILTVGGHDDDARQSMLFKAAAHLRISQRKACQ